jgi:putative inorganic carbon (hco3(-)) transporter
MRFPGRQAERLAFGGGVQVNAAAIGSNTVGPATTRLVPAVRRTDWAFRGLLAFTLVLFVRPQDKVHALQVVHLAEIFAIVALSSMVVQRLSRSLPLVPLTAEVGGIFGFGAVIAATIPTSFWPGDSLALLVGVYAKAALIFVLMVSTLESVSRLTRLLWTIVVGSAYVGALTVADYARGVNLVENGRLAGAVSGVFGNPNDLALNMVAFLPFAIILAVRATRPLSRGLAGAFGLLMAATAVLTKSRSGFLGMLVMLGTLFLLGGQVKRGFRIAVVTGCLLAIPMLPSSFWTRMSSITSASADETGSREARQTVMGEAWQVFLERPLTGVGAGQFKNYNPPWRRERWREAHDVWLQVASETGIVGLAVFLFIVVRGFGAALAARRIVQARGRAPVGNQVAAGQKAADPEARTLALYSTALVASMAGWGACSVFASVAYNWTLYYLLGLAVAARTLATDLGSAAATTGPESQWPSGARPTATRRM